MRFLIKFYSHGYFQMFNKLPTEMNFVPLAKQKELSSALERISSMILIVYGPPGSSKTYTVERVADSMGLSIEYMEDVEVYKNSLLMNNMICMTDMDDHSLFMRCKDKLSKMKKLVIETRTLPFIGRSLPNAITVNFNKVTNAKLRRICNLNDKELEVIDGNLHSLRFYRYSVRNQIMPMYHQLGRIFYSKVDGVEKIAMRVKIYGVSRFSGYIAENCVSFMEIGSVRKVLDGLSLLSLDDESFLDHMLWILLEREKKKTGGFFSFRSFGGVNSGHVCSKICKNR